MNNKKEINNAAEDLNQLIDDKDVLFDLSNLKVLSADGALVNINNEEGRILFFNQIPIITEKNSNNKKINKCILELRMTSTRLKVLSELLNATISTCEQIQEIIPDNESEIIDNQPPMFG